MLWFFDDIFGSAPIRDHPGKTDVRLPRLDLDPFLIGKHIQTGRIKDVLFFVDHVPDRLDGFFHTPAATFSYDLCMQFNALPKIPVLMLFNDADKEFPAQCAVLFERRAEKYLDMECLAMVGMLLFEYLKDGFSR